MAETLGIVASGIAIAQIAGAAGSSMIKLRKLWDEIRNVPDTIADLMEQIDCLQPALLDAERNLTSNNIPAEFWDDTSAKRGATYCQKALHELSDVTSDLSTYIQSAKGIRRKARHLRVVLKKDELVSLERRLERAVRLLQFAQQGYILAFMRFQSDIVATKVVEQLNQERKHIALKSDKKPHVAKSDHHDESSLESRTFRNKSQKSTSSWNIPVLAGLLVLQSSARGYSAKFQPCWWLAGSTYAWEVNMRKAYAGWRIHLRPYSVVDLYSPVICAAEDGDNQLLQELFQSGAASPFDRDQYGHTLLHKATYNRHTSTLKFLVQQGANIDEVAIHGGTVKDLATGSTGGDACISKQLEFADALISLGVFDDLNLDETTTTCRCPGVPLWEVFKHLQPLLCPNHAETTINTRLQSLKMSTCTDMRILTFILGTNWKLNTGDYCNPRRGGFSLIHSIAGLSCQENRDTRKSWYDLALYVIRRTRNKNRLAHTPFTGVVTPLRYAIHHTNVSKNTKHWRLGRDTEFPSHLKDWLRVLKEAGTDLLEYGKRENKLLRSGKESSRDWEWVSKRAYEQVELYAFRIGPEVDDWGVWWREISDEYAGEFWASLEEPSLHVPGAWV